MDVNLSGFLLISGCGAALCILWFFLELRKKAGSGRSALVSLSTLVLGTVLGIALARTVWVLCMLRYHFPLEHLRSHGRPAGGGDPLCRRLPG